MIPIILTLISGLATVLGALLVLKKPTENILIASLSFGCGIMITISLTDLLIEANHLINQKIIIICIIIGMLITMLIEKKIPQQGLYKIGIISMIGLSLHNFPEGIITYITASHNINLGIKLAIAIAFHNFPEGIIIAIPIYYATKNKTLAITLTLISGLSETLAALITHFFLKEYITNLNLGILFSLVIGIMLYISLFKLLKESISYQKYKLTYISFLIGVLLILAI